MAPHIDFLPLSSKATASSPPTASIVCLGNFDGVHFAHRSLLRQAKKAQQEKFPHALCTVLCFQNPSFDDLLKNPPYHLSTLEQKIQYFKEEGMDAVFLTDFSSIKELTPKEFATTILMDICGCVCAVCGFNYHFGKDGKGTPNILSALLPIKVLIQPKICLDGIAVSSSRIRKMIQNGDMETAKRLLARHYCFTAPVLHGKALGRNLGAPTINQSFPPRMQVPRLGVYITDCIIDGQHYRGVSNVGAHPTVDVDAQINCETHLLGFYSQEIYLKAMLYSIFV